MVEGSEFDDLCAQLATAAQQGIAASSERPEQAQQAEASTDDVWMDLQSLAKLTKHYTTALTLALKEAETGEGCATLLRSLLDTTLKLVFAVSSLSPLPNLWEKEIRYTCFLPLFEGISALSKTLCKSGTLNRQQILQSTGQIWAAVDHITQTASTTRSAAFEKAVKGLLETLEDALAEVKEMCEQDSSEDESGGEDYDEMGGMHAELSAPEKERASNVSVILRMTRLLFKRVGKSPNLTELDSAFSVFNSVIEKADDLVAACHPPQDPATLSEEVVAFVRSTQILASLPDRTNDITSRMNNLKVNATDANEVSADDKKWREMCIVQIRKASLVLLVDGHALPAGLTS